ncbi:hypothetical protein ACLOJK_005983 [Asimina triloba]
MRPRKVTYSSSSSDAEQLAQLPEHVEEGLVEDFLKDSPSPLEPSIFPLWSLALSVIALVEPDLGGPVIRVEFATFLEIIKSLQRQFSQPEVEVQHQMACTQLEPPSAPPIIIFVHPA